MLGVLLMLCGLGLTLQAQSASAATAYGVTETNNLISFDTGTPGTVTTIGPITGLLGVEQILALDFRPLNGRLYGVSASNLYVIDPQTAAASLLSQVPFPVPLTGSVAMDFDPVSDFIRVVTDTNQNLRVNPLNGATTADTAINPASGVAAIAFTNNFSAPDRATLFGLDATSNQLVRIGGADLADGGASQAAGAVTPIGALTFDTAGLAGFDILANGNAALAVMAAAADVQSTLFRVDLTTGTATSAGLIAAAGRVRAFAVLSRAVTIYGLTTASTSAPAGALVTFLSAVPGTLLPEPGGAPLPITGLDAGETVLAIDVRPATGQLYGITSGGRLVILNPETGQASASILLPPFTINGVVAGFDFNPTVDRLRVTTDTGQNLVVHPDTGAPTPQTALSVPTIVGLAYSNNLATATATTLYAVDAAANQFGTIATPASGVFTPIATPLAPDVDVISGFDIAAADNIAYLSVTAPSATTSTLYSVDLPSAVSTPIGEIGGGLTIRGLAVASPGIVHLSSTAYSALENAGSALITVQREGGSDGAVTVELQAAAGTATSPADFIAGTFNVEFANGETAKTVSVIIQNDTDVEGNETVNLTLSDPRLGAALGTPATGVLTIVDNDPGAGGAAPTVTIQSPTGDPTYTATSLFLRLSGVAADDDGTVASVTWVSDRGFTGTASIGAPGASVEWFADISLAAGVNTITVTATDNAGNQASDTIVISVNELAYFLAEGATGVFFDLDLLLANPNATPVNVTATFLKPLGQGTVVQHYTLPATSRTTVNVETIPGLEGAEVSTIVTAPATQPIVVERTMRWDDTGYGAHTDKASAGASQKWFFAEGSQGFFFTYLLLANPQNAANEVTVRYLREGAPMVTRTYNLAPLERFTVDIGADADLVNSSFGMEVTFQQPGIAERAMYFGLDPLWVGGHESVGVTLPSRSWFLAEGATGPFFETFVLFANPGSAEASIDVRYLPSFGAPVDKTYTVPAQSRLTVNVEQEDASLTNAAVATQVASTVPILVERAQYWPDPAPQWYEAHNSFGLTSLSTRWGLAEGRVGGSAEYQTYILLANTNSIAVDVTIQFLRENGTTLTKVFTVQPSSRFNVAVGSADVPEITNEAFGAVITSPQPIAVERAMYSNARGQIWQAGTNATGTQLPVPVPVP